MLSETVVRRLVYVKLLHTISKERYENGSEIDTMQSILTLDNSFENLFWVILDTMDSVKADDLRRKNYPTFQNLLNEVKRFVNDDLSIVKEMHEARNLIQHSGIMVSDSHAKKYHLYSDEMLPKLCYNVLNVKWEDISLSMLIEDKKIARYYKEGEELFAKKEFRNAALKIIQAFEKAKEDRQFRQFGSLILGDMIAAQEAIKETEDETLTKMLNYIDKIYTEVEVLKLGLDYKEWREYRLPLGSLNPYDELESLFPKPPPIPRSDKPLTSEWDDDIFKDTKPIRQEEPTSSEKKEENDKPMFLTMSEDEIRLWLTKVMPFIIRSILYWQQSKGLWD